MKIKLHSDPEAILSRLSTGGAGFLVGVALSTGIFFTFFNNPQLAATPLRQSDLNPDQPFTLIDPLIGLKTNGVPTPPDYQSLQSSIEAYLNQAEEAGDLEIASVNLRDIRRSVGITINPDEKYSPSSLLKVPTMMAYLKLAESDPAILSENLLYGGATDFNEQENIKSPVQLQKGKFYSVEQLLEHMIQYSDNNAATLLIDNLNSTRHSDAFNTLFKDLGITQIDLNNDFITIQGYNLFFRVLYNATYLSRAMSQKALELLTKTDFTRGLDVGIPNNVVVAHKFGEFTIKNSDTGDVLKRELHDCGIVYYPGHPYTLCVMTKGQDFAKLETVINTVSAMIYEHIEKAYPLESK